MEQHCGWEFVDNCNYHHISTSILKEIAWERAIVVFSCFMRRSDQCSSCFVVGIWILVSLLMTIMHWRTPSEKEGVTQFHLPAPAAQGWCKDYQCFFFTRCPWSAESDNFLSSKFCAFDVKKENLFWTILRKWPNSACQHQLLLKVGSRLKTEKFSGQHLFRRQPLHLSLAPPCSIVALCNHWRRKHVTEWVIGAVLMLSHCNHLDIWFSFAVPWKLVSKNWSQPVHMLHWTRTCLNPEFQSSNKTWTQPSCSHAHITSQDCIIVTHNSHNLHRWTKKRERRR